jgi:hypothetical protein
VHPSPIRAVGERISSCCASDGSLLREFVSGQFSANEQLEKSQREDQARGLMEASFSVLLRETRKWYLNLQPSEREALEKAPSSLDALESILPPVLRDALDGLTAEVRKQHQSADAMVPLFEIKKKV